MNNEEIIFRIQNGEENLKEEFVVKNQKLVYAMAHRLTKSKSMIEELFQVGCIGLMKALNQFDISYQVKFSTYAVPLILGEMKKYFRDQTSIHISRTIKEQYTKILKVQEELTQKFGRSASYYEIAKEVNMHIEDVLVAFEAHQHVHSLDEPLPHEDDCLFILLKDPKQKDITMNISLQKELQKLSDQEKKVIYYRYYCNLVQQEVATYLDVSQVQVSRMEKQILKKLKSALSEF